MRVFILLKEQVIYLGYLDCADKLREKYSNQITNSKPKIILHQNDNEWGSHVQRFP